MEKTNGYIYLSSKDSADSALANKASIVYVNTISLIDSSKICLSSFDFLYYIDNINDLNNISYLDTGSQSYPILLSNGKYDYDELGTEVESKLNALGLGAFVVTFSDNKYVITSPVPVFFTTNYRSSHTDFIDMMGILKNTSLNTTFTSLYVDIAYTNNIFICSDVIHSNKKLHDNNTTSRINNILGVIYVNANNSLGSDKITGSPIDITNPKHITERIHNLKWINQYETRDIGRIDINLYDDDGFLIPNYQFKYTLELMIE